MTLQYEATNHLVTEAMMSGSGCDARISHVASPYQSARRDHGCHQELVALDGAAGCIVHQIIEHMDDLHAVAK